MQIMVGDDREDQYGSDRKRKLMLYYIPPLY